MSSFSKFNDSIWIKVSTADIFNLALDLLLFRWDSMVVNDYFFAYLVNSFRLECVIAFFLLLWREVDWRFWMFYWRFLFFFVNEVDELDLLLCQLLVQSELAFWIWTPHIHLPGVCQSENMVFAALNPVYLLAKESDDWLRAWSKDQLLFKLKHVLKLFTFDINALFKLLESILGRLLIIFCAFVKLSMVFSINEVWEVIVRNS